MNEIRKTDIVFVSTTRGEIVAMFAGMLCTNMWRRVLFSASCALPHIDSVLPSGNTGLCIVCMFHPLRGKSAGEALWVSSHILSPSFILESINSGERVT